MLEEETNCDKAPATNGHHTIGLLPTPTKLLKAKKRIGSAQDAVFLADDGFVIADRFNTQVRLFDSNAKFRKVIAHRVKPMGVTANYSDIVVFTDGRSKKSGCVRLYSTTTCEEISHWGESFIWRPHAIVLTNRGQLVVTSTQLRKKSVCVYTYDGRPVQSLCGTQFDQPLYVATDGHQRILVSDKGSCCVKIFSDGGRLLNQVGSRGSGDGELLGPRGVCVDNKNNIFVCDTDNRRVSVFAADGRFMQHIFTAKDALQFPFGIAFSKLSRRLVVTQCDSPLGGFRKLRIYETHSL